MEHSWERNREKLEESIPCNCFGHYGKKAMESHLKILNNQTKQSNLLLRVYFLNGSKNTLIIIH